MHFRISGYPRGPRKVGGRVGPSPGAPPADAPMEDFAAEQAPPPEAVLAARKGTVLCRGTMLKADHFPGCQSKRLKPRAAGAPNFRAAPGLPIYGVPTLEGAVNVLEDIVLDHGEDTTVLWHNMREEPVLYVHGVPYVVREAAKPFANVEYRGIDAKRLEAMERTLKRDVLAEAARYSGHIMVTEETDDMEVVSVWRDCANYRPSRGVEVESVLTPLELYEHLSRTYRVDYLRVPLTDEKAPTAYACDVLVDRLARFRGSGEERGFCCVFNCQMGRGRTTTGMAIASLVLTGAGMGRLPAEPAQDTSMVASPPSQGGAYMETDMRNGRYPVIRSLMRTLEHGPESKTLLDRVLDICGDFQNLREAIHTMRLDVLKEHDDRKKSQNLSRCADYLERYAVLLLFASYVLDEREGDERISFDKWWSKRPELSSVLNRLLRRDPLAALLLHKGPDAPPTPLAVGSAAASEAGVGVASAQEAMDIVAERNGDVLGHATIVKEDFFPGCQYAELEPRFYPHAPNFRQAPSKPVYGTAIPTAEGVRDVLAAAGCYVGADATPCVWHNLREEAMVYLKGKPYVLREARRPYHNMEEYMGIDARRLEAMEDRLRLDVVAEARIHGGRLLVSRESEDGSLYDTWLDVPTDDDVCTPKTVFDRLVAEGVPVTYARVPMTDGYPPKLRDLDEVTANVQRAVHDGGGAFPALVFSCQIGRGRTTTGMIVGCLLHDRLTLGTLVPATLPFGGGVGSIDALERLSDDSATGTGRRGSFEELTRAGGRGTMNRTPSLDSVASLCETSDDDVFGTHSPDPARRSRFGPKGAAGRARNRWYPLEMGYYAPVRWLCQVLDRGEVVKAGLDAVTDLCGALLNVRIAPLFESGLVRAVQGPHEKISSGYLTNEDLGREDLDDEEYRRDRIRRTSNLQRGAQLLQRYYLLVAYAWWLECRMDAPRMPSGEVLPAAGQESFEEWMSTRPEVVTMRASIVSNPALALAPPVPVSEQVRGLEGLLDGEEARPEGIDAWAGPAEGSAALPSCAPREQMQVLRSRKGNVLGRRAILKLYHFPGVEQQASAHSGDLPPLLGVPNLCAIPATKARRTRVVTAAVPTREGMHNLLNALDTRRSGAALALADLREDAVVYMNGNPYVLRDLERPQSELGYAGMGPDSLAALEERLKEDVLAEGARRKKRILVHAEAPCSETGMGGLLQGPAGIGTEASDSTHVFGASSPGHEVRAYYLTLADAETPAAFFASFGKEAGMALQYRRVPLSRARRPAVVDLDRIHDVVRGVSAADAGDSDATVLFVSHTGLGTSVRFACIAAMLALASPEDWLTEAADADLRTETEAELPAIRTVARALPHGSLCLRVVHRVMSELAPSIGDLRCDIADCTRAARAGGWPKSPSRKAAGAAALGLNYVKRFFHLVSFAAFLTEAHEHERDGSSSRLAYSTWFARRTELVHFEEALTL